MHEWLFTDRAKKHTEFIWADTEEAAIETYSQRFPEARIVRYQSGLDAKWHDIDIQSVIEHRALESLIQEVKETVPKKILSVPRKTKNRL